MVGWYSIQWICGTQRHNVKGKYERIFFLSWAVTTIYTITAVATSSVEYCCSPSSQCKIQETNQLPLWICAHLYLYCIHTSWCNHCSHNRKTLNWSLLKLEQTKYNFNFICDFYLNFRNTNPCNNNYVLGLRSPVVLRPMTLFNVIQILVIGDFGEAEVLYNTCKDLTRFQLKEGH